MGLRSLNLNDDIGIRVMEFGILGWRPSWWYKFMNKVGVYFQYRTIYIYSQKLGGSPFLFSVRLHAAFVP